MSKVATFRIPGQITFGAGAVETIGTEAKRLGASHAFVLSDPNLQKLGVTDPEGYPATAPPWGTLNAINLNTGEYAWKIPLGEYPELVEKGIKDTGSENYGGPIVTAGGLVFIGATNHDRKFRAFDKDTGKLLWETVMPSSGNATPATYEVNGRQYVVIVAAGGYGRSASTAAVYVAFALPEGAAR